MDEYPLSAAKGQSLAVTAEQQKLTCGALTDYADLHRFPDTG